VRTSAVSGFVQFGESLRVSGGGAYLCVSRIGVKDIREEFTRTGHARDDQSVDVKAIDNKEMGEVIIFTLGVEGG
jgi:hypothetical protein